MWNDDALKSTNTPAVAAALPAQPIVVGYSDSTGLNVADVFKAALSSFSPSFATALAQANNSFAQLLGNNPNVTAESASAASNRVTFIQVSDLPLWSALHVVC